MKRGCGGGKGGVVLGLQKQNPPGLCFSGHCDSATPAGGHDSFLGVRTQKKKGEEKRRPSACHSGAERQRSAYYSTNAREQTVQSVCE